MGAVVLLVMPVTVLGELVLAGLRQLVQGFMQTASNAARTGRSVATERLHIALARLLPCRDLGLDFVEMISTSSGQLIRMLLEAGDEARGAWRHIGAQGTETVTKAARNRGDVGT